MRKIILTALLLFSSISSAEEISAAYKHILFEYAKVNLEEFEHLESIDTEFSKYAIEDRGTFIRTTDDIGRVVYVVLFPRDESSVYVSFLLNKDGLLEPHGRGGIPPSPEAFKSDIKGNLYHVVYYPGSA